MTDVVISDLVSELEAIGIQLWEDGGQVRFRALKGAMTEERRSALQRRKAALVDYLRDDVALEAVTSEHDARHDPFPLTDVQSAYLLGRDDGYEYGGVGCQVYLEAAFATLDAAAMAAAWQTIVDRHPMLRAVVDTRGFQRVLPDVPPYRMPVADLRATTLAAATAAIEAIGEEMGHRSYRPDEWPLFDVRITLAPDRALLHLSFDFLIADFMSIQLMLDELHQLYFTPGVALPDIDITFRDYAQAERRLKERRRYQRAREYWWGRLDDLPPAPTLPVLDRPKAKGEGRFVRWETALTRAEWAFLRTRSGDFRLTPSGAVLAAYAEVIGRWTRQERFTLNITLLNRLPVHPHAERLVGDFTTVDLLAVAQDPSLTFAQRADAIQAQLWADMDHLNCSGVEVLREIGRRRGRAAALMPIVFTSAIALNDQGQEPRFWRDATLVHGLTQTPQVWIDCQVMVRDGGLAVNWDVREGVFPPGLVDEMFAAFAALLRRLASDGAAWERPAALGLPAAQAARRRAVNDTADDSIPSRRRLHDAVVERCRDEPGRPAAVGTWGSLSYGELLARSSAVAEALRVRGVGPGELVGVVMEKGPDQLVGVLAVLLGGAAYVPIDVTQPAPRRERMLTDAGIGCVLTGSKLAAGLAWPAGIEVVEVDSRAAPADAAPIGERPEATADSPAYVIYTSGSTGTPKGVQVSHRSALNTIEDINRRFGVSERDRVLALANLGFDLSVYDLFGLLAVGGCVVFPDPDRRSDPSHWAELVAEFAVTLWNSVPAQMQMLVDYLDADPMADASSVRLAMLSGDWIPVNLPDRVRLHLPGANLVSLGGATEAAIWSIFFPIGAVEPSWPSIPYGRPLANQDFYVLDRWMRDCPDGVTGELYIGGLGLAVGYLGDPERTDERFVTHPHTGRRLYRTGDLGRYLPDGNIEFQGREDSQVKIRGHRIELAEIEAAMVGLPSVSRVAVLVAGDGPLDRRLVAFAEPSRCLDDGPGRRLAEGLVSTAEDAGRAVMAGVDRVGYVDYLRRLDHVALLAMMRAFAGEGLFTTPTAGSTLDEILEGMKVSPRHFRVVRRWLRALVEHGLLRLDAGARYFAPLPVTPDADEAGWRLVDEQQGGLDPASAKVHEYFKASTASLAELLRGETAGAVQLLFPEGRLDVTESLYNVTLFNRWANHIIAATARRIAADTARHGPLRILEVGAGVGGTSKDVIPALADQAVDYVFTDLSQFFLNQARDTFGAYPWVRYATLDLNHDIGAQGFSPNSFDVVILGDVLHATRHVGRSVATLRQLLAPQGWLVFAEMTRDHYQIMTSMELLLLDEVAHGDFEDLRRGRDQMFVGHRDWLELLAHPGDEIAFHLPHDDDVLAEIGLRVYATRVKTDRARVEPGEITAAVAARLPAAMVPTAVEILEEFPLTANAKVDRDKLRSSLPAPAASRLADASDEAADDLERRIATRWAEVLALPHVGRSQGFFDIGGDSLLASQLTGRLIELPEAANVDFNAMLRQLLEGPTVAAVAARLREAP